MHRQVLGAKVKLMALQESLLDLEMDAVEVVAELVTEFDRSYCEMAEANKLQYNSYFTQVVVGNNLLNMKLTCLLVAGSVRLLCGTLSRPSVESLSKTEPTFLR